MEPVAAKPKTGEPFALASVPVPLSYILERFVHRKRSEEILTFERLFEDVRKFYTSFVSVPREEFERILQTLIAQGIISQLDTWKNGPCYICADCDKHRTLGVDFIRS